MPFLTKPDLYTDMYQEDIDVITEGDDTQVTSAITKAIGEAKGYCSLYDVPTLFGEIGTFPTDPILRAMCIALTLYWLTKKMRRKPKHQTDKGGCRNRPRLAAPGAKKANCRNRTGQP